MFISRLSKPERAQLAFVMCASEADQRAVGTVKRKHPGLQPLHGRVVIEITHGTYGAQDEALEALVSVRPATGVRGQVLMSFRVRAHM